MDRIGQKAGKILCYSFLPADGVERIIRLRARVRQRLKENAEVVGTDEAFFEDERNDQAIRDLFNEKAGILDGEADTEVDLASYAYQIWKNAIDQDPALEQTIPDLPDVVLRHKPRERLSGPAQTSTLNPQPVRWSMSARPTGPTGPGLGEPKGRHGHRIPARDSPGGRLRA